MFGNFGPSNQGPRIQNMGGQFRPQNSMMQQNQGPFGGGGGGGAAAGAPGGIPPLMGMKPGGMPSGLGAGNQMLPSVEPLMDQKPPLPPGPPPEEPEVNFNFRSEASILL
jgi:hypothetical protein